jgi:drug/metabolite transporter (DMT)-like permease
MVILRPGFARSSPTMLLMVLGSLLFAIAAVITKKLIVTEATFSIMVWMNLMQLPMNLAGSDLSFVFRLDASMALPLLGIAVAGLASHYCLTNAFRCGDASIVIPMDFPARAADRARSAGCFYRCDIYDRLCSSARR